MKLETQDIILQEFRKVLRGYDPVEVKAFLEIIAEKYRQAVQDQQKLQRTIQELRQSNSGLTEQLNEAEKEIDQLKSDVRKIDRLVDARIDSDLILQKAHEDADKILREAKADANRMKNEIRHLNEQKQRSAAVLKDYLLKQLSALELISEETPVRLNEQKAETSGTTDDDQPADEAISGSVEDIHPSAKPPEEISQTVSSIGSYLDHAEFDELPNDIEAAILEQPAEPELSASGSVLSDERRKRMVQDLDQLSEQATSMFRKADFEKMIGEEALKKSEDIINQIYSELEKKKNKNSSTTENP